MQRKLVKNKCKIRFITGVSGSLYSPPEVISNSSCFGLNSQRANFHAQLFAIRVLCTTSASPPQEVKEVTLNSGEYESRVVTAERVRGLLACGCGWKFRSRANYPPSDCSRWKIKYVPWKFRGGGRTRFRRGNRE